MDNIKFESLNELYDRLYPAFNTKKIELFGKNIIVKEIELWNFLKDSKWTNGSNIKLSDMVNDIIHLDEEKLKKYLKKGD